MDGLTPIAGTTESFICCGLEKKQEQLVESDRIDLLAG